MNSNTAGSFDPTHHLDPGGAPGRDATILVAGGRGMVGSALLRRLQAGGYTRLLAPPRSELDLMDPRAVQAYLLQHRPDYVFVAAARVGGIQANNTLRADFLYENLAIQNHLIHGAHLAGVQRLMFLGSSCIYPRDCPQPIREEYLLTGPLEPTNEPYAIAKIAGIKLCEAINAQHGRQYISVMPTNLYGPGDHYDLNNCHVLPALLRKAHEAAASQSDTCVVWGSGTPLREFLFVDDLADALVHLMVMGYVGPLLNIGSGDEVSIGDLAALIARVVGFRGRLVFDRSKPDGTPRKRLDTSRLQALGWCAPTSLGEGVRRTWQASPFGPVAGAEPR